MIIIILVVILSIAYAVAFKNDVPPVVVKRVLILFSIILAVLNYGYILGAIKSIIMEVLKAGGVS